MKLKIKYLELTDFRLTDYCYGSHLSAPLGFFDHISGILHCYYDSHWQELSGDISKLIQQLSDECNNLTFDGKLRYLVERTVSWHEHRHYVDCFCTPYGMSTLYDMLDLYFWKSNLIYEYLNENNLDGSNGIEFAKMSDSQASLQHYLMHKSEHISLNNATSPIYSFDGHDTEHDFYVAKCTDSLGKEIILPCITVNVIQQGKTKCCLWPISFAILTETLAQISQEFIIGSVDSDVRNAYRNSLRNSLNPYVPMIANLCRIFKNRGVAMMDIDDSFLYELLYSSMYVISGECYEKTNQADICAAGWRLISIIEEQCNIDNKQIIYSPESIDRESFKITKTIPKGFPFDLFTHIKDNYFHKSLEIKEQNDKLRYTAHVSLLLYLPLLPLPPLIVMSDGVLNVNDNNYYYLWQNIMMYRQLVDCIWNGIDCECPVLDNEFSKYYSCDQLRPCGDHYYLCLRKDMNLMTTSSHKKENCFWERYVNSFFNERII